MALPHCVLDLVWLVGLGLLLVVDGIPRRDMMPRRSDAQVR